jgi:SAM-dependent methyltransferase
VALSDVGGDSAFAGAAFPERWSRADVQALACERASRYQKVALPFGLATGGRDRSPTARLVLPPDLRGKTVLDVGCRVGYFCFEAARRGAARVVGLDWNAEAVSKGRRLADCLGLDVEFRRADADRELPDEPFDHVLCLNLLHHLRDPLAALERLASIARERLVLEVAGFGRNDRRNPGLAAPLAWLLARLPVIYAAPTGPRGGRSVPRFYVAAPALRNLLLRQRRTFARLEVVRSPLKRRYVAIAHKRRIGHLVVVAGPVGAGKARLVRRLLAGEAPALAERLGLGDPAEWRSCAGRDLGRLEEPVIPKLLLRYDLPDLSLDSGEDALGVASTAERLTFLTVHCPAEVLRARLAARPVAASTRRGRLFQGRLYLRLRSAYEDASRVEAGYERWLERVRDHPLARHVTVSVGDGWALAAPR